MKTNKTTKEEDKYGGSGKEKTSEKFKTENEKPHLLEPRVFVPHPAKPHLAKPHPFQLLTHLLSEPSGENGKHHPPANESIPPPPPMNARLLYHQN